MDWKRSARRDLLVGGAVVVAMVGLVVLGTGSRAAQPTATSAPAPVAAVADGAAGPAWVAAGSAAVASPTSAARHRPAVPPEVAGWVRDAAARPEADVAVDFIATDGTVRSASTTADGAFAIVLPDGSYRVVCGVAGATCVTDSGTDTVLVSGPAALDLEVQSPPRG